MTTNWNKVKRARKWRRIGQRIRAARDAQGLSQSDAAERCGLTYSYLSQLECGYYCPSVAVADRIAKGLKTTIAALLENAVT